MLSLPCVLSLRDVLSWARFMVEACAANRDLAVLAAYYHGAFLMHLDGIGLGAGMSLADAAHTKARAEAFLMGQLSDCGCDEHARQTIQRFVVHNGGFGAEPFFIPVGSAPIQKSTFSFMAPTTFLNMFRVVRAMQVAKPLLLEGPPGVGKTR